MNPAYHEIFRIMGLNIAYYRNLRQMSQEQLGDKLGFEQSYMSKIERAAVGISMDTLCEPKSRICISLCKSLTPSTVMRFK